MSGELQSIKQFGGRVGLLSAAGILLDCRRFQLRGHAACGPVFKTKVFGREVFFIDIRAPGLDRDMLWAESEQISFIEAYRDLFNRLFGNLFLDIDKRLRQGLSFAYIKRHIGSTQSYLRRYLDDRLGDEGSIDGVEFFSQLVVHVLLRYVCGPAVCDRIGVRVAHLLNLLESDYSVIGMMLPIETPALRRRVAAREELQGLFEGVVRERLKAGEQHEDFLGYLIDGKSKARDELDADDIRELGLRLMGLTFGAHTNTSVTVPAMLVDILERSGQIATLRKQIDEFACDGEVEFAQLTKLTELHRCITETVRLKSNGIMWRKALTQVSIGGHDIAAGSIIGASIGLINLDAGRFEHPQSYCPARFEQRDTDQFQCPSITVSPTEYCAFGTGRNICSGRQLAYVLLSTIFVRLLSDFDWSLSRRPWFWFNLIGPGVARPIGGITFKYRRR